MKKRIALVTGSNKGIGFEICRQLAEAGLVVILTARNERKGVDAAEKLRTISKEVFFHQLDVTDENSVEKLSQHVAKNFGQLDVLVNNAGIISSSKSISETNMEEIKKVMETNYFGVIRVTQAMVPLLQKSSDGRIINMSSGMGAHDSLTGDYGAYRLSKAGLNDITLMFANDLKENGIKVNAVCPGWVQTDMGGPNAPRSTSQGADTVFWLATIEKTATGKFFRDRKEIEW